MPRLPTMSRLGNNSAHLMLFYHSATLTSVTMTYGGPPIRWPFHAPRLLLSY